jgi:hypothetical protein
LDQTRTPHEHATASSKRKSGSGEPDSGSPNRQPSPTHATLPRQSSPSMPSKRPSSFAHTSLRLTRQSDGSFNFN